MPPALFAVAVCRHAGRIGNLYLHGKRLNDGLRHGGRIAKERTEKSHGGQLQSVTGVPQGLLRK